MGEKVSFEAALSKLEAIVEALEKGQLSLEESIRTYEEGVALAGRCAELLKDAEIKVQKLTRRAEGVFDVEDIEGVGQRDADAARGEES